MRGTRGRRQATAIALVALGAAAPAQAGERVDFDMRFAEQATGAVTAMELHLRYKAAGGDPEAKPSPIRHLVLETPAGTRYGNGHPACPASDDEFRLLGRDACEEDTVIGAGNASVITGVPPLDPFPVDLTLYATPEGFVELAQAPGTNATLAIERVRVTGSRLEADIGIPPGGPPDGRSGVNQVDFVIEPNGFVVTPPECPASGAWGWSGTFTFDDGTTVTEATTTPCAAPVAAAAPVAKTGRLKVSPRRVRAGRRAKLRVRVPTVRRCRAGHVVRLGDAQATTNARGRATLATRLSPGRHRVTSTRDGCLSRAAWVRARG
jgi:hypothetical protein